MRWKAIIVLAAIVLAFAAAPLTLQVVVADNRVRIGTLDVCHSAVPALSLNGDMPFLSAGIEHHTPFSATADAVLPEAKHSQILFTDLTEQPPNK